MTGDALKVAHRGEDAIKMINEEGHLRAEVGDDLGVRGFWAARCQMLGNPNAGSKEILADFGPTYHETATNAFWT